MAKTMGRPVIMPAADNIVAETRRKLNVSQEELAAMLQLTRGAISHFESGKCKISGPVKLLCKLLLKHPDILAGLE